MIINMDCRVATLLAMTVAIISINNAQAHGGGCACSSFRGAGLAGPIITIPAYTMPKGMTSIGLGLGYQNSGRLDARQITKVRRSGSHADDNYGSLTPSLSLSHGFTERFQANINIPFIINWDYREIHDEGLEELGDSIGFGDITLMAQYQALKLETFQAALIGGIKLPTGPSNIRGNTGERFEAINQPGTGSFDPLFGIALSKQFGRLGLDSNFLYRLSTEGSQDTVVGDIASYNIALSYAINHDHDKDQFHHHHLEDRKKTILQKIFPEHILGRHLTWDLILEANTTWEESPEISEVKDANHGGTLVVLSPGIRMTVNDSWVYNLSIGFPIVEDLKGEQGGSDLQLFFGMATTL